MEQLGATGTMPEFGAELLPENNKTVWEIYINP